MTTRQKRDILFEKFSYLHRRGDWWKEIIKLTSNPIKFTELHDNYFENPETQSVEALFKNPRWIILINLLYRDLEINGKL